MTSNNYIYKKKRLKAFGLSADAFETSMELNLPGEIYDCKEQVLIATLFYLTLSKMAKDKKWFKNITEIINLINKR